MPTNSIRSLAAMAAVSVGSLTVLVAPAGAQACYPPSAGCVSTTNPVVTAGPVLSLSRSVVSPGQTITATVSGFQAGSTGIFSVASVEQQIGSFTMPANGAAASASITIPATIELGAHTVFARGTAINGQPASASQGITVVAAGTAGTTGTAGTAGTTSSLARTGVVVVPTVLVGLGLVAGGLVLKRSSKRGKATSTV